MQQALIPQLNKSKKKNQKTQVVAETGVEKVKGLNGQKEELRQFQVSTEQPNDIEEDEEDEDEENSENPDFQKVVDDDDDDDDDDDEDNDEEGKELGLEGKAAKLLDPVAKTDKQNLKKEKKKEQQDEKKITSVDISFAEPKRKGKEEKKKEEKQKTKEGKTKSIDKETPEETTEEEIQSKQPKKKQKKLEVEEPDDFMFGKLEIKEKVLKKTNPGGPNNSKKKKLRESTLLRNLEAQEEKVERLKAKDPDLAEEYLQQKGVDNALLRASGERVLNQKRVIQKVMKAKKKKKEKGAALWRERQATTKAASAERQKKRTENIKAKRGSKQNKRVFPGKEKKTST